MKIIPECDSVERRVKTEPNRCAAGPFCITTHGTDIERRARPVTCNINRRDGAVAARWDFTEETRGHLGSII